MKTAVKPAEPELTPLTASSVSGSRAAEAVSVDVTALSAFVNREFGRIENLDRHLDNIEKSLFDPLVLSRMPAKDIALVYQLALQRKENSSRFVIRLLELGIKSKWLGKLLEGENHPGDSMGEVIKLPAHVEDARAMIQAEMARKFAVPVTKPTE